MVIQNSKKLRERFERVIITLSNTPPAQYLEFKKIQ